MKKVIILLIVLCSSCSIFYDKKAEYVEEFKVLFEKCNLKSLDYIPDDGLTIYSNWKSPIEMINDGGGDCEDFAFLYGFYFKECENRNVCFAKLKNDKYTDSHTICIIDGKWRDYTGKCQSFKYKNESKLRLQGWYLSEYIDYNYCMNIATSYYNK